MCSVDLPARAILANSKQYNGEYGCIYCEAQGVQRRGAPMHRNWPYESVVPRRTHISILRNAKNSMTSTESEKVS